MTINRFWRSAMSAHHAAGQIALVRARVIICAGVESMNLRPTAASTRCPTRALAAKSAALYRHGQTAENVASQYKMASACRSRRWRFPATPRPLAGRPATFTAEIVPDPDQ